ncbi:MAG TPA: hypothetical protein VIL74_04025, partial [Pyrinomonadaceae bacterium]
MTKKAPKDEPKIKPGIQINRSRGGGKKKPDLFARLRDTGHPLDNIIPVELDFQPGDKLDVQPIINRTSSEFTTGRPEEKNLGAQPRKQKTSRREKLGRPATNALDVLASSAGDWTSSETQQLDAKTSSRKLLDVQPTKKNEKWRNWEKSRGTDRVSLRPASDILRKFKVFCAEKGLGMTEFFEIAGLKFIELDVQSEQQLDVLTPIDDRRLKIMFKTKPFIINLYLRYNSVFNELSSAAGKKWTARWSPRDD